MTPEDLRRQTPPQSAGRGARAAPTADAALEQDERREPELIERIKRGEKELFHELIRPHERRVYLTALAILRNEADAEDVAQDAILKAFEHLSQFRQESRFSTWLFRVTVNEARMRQRKEHRDIMKPLGEEGNEEGGYTPQDFTDWREIPSEALERKEVRELLARALASLAQKYREVFMLRDVHQVSIEQAAEIIGISPGAVKTRLLRARLMLRDLLAPGLAGALQSGSQVPKGSKPWS